MSGFRGSLEYVRVERHDLAYPSEDEAEFRIVGLGKLKPKEVADPKMLVGALIRLTLDMLLAIDDEVWKLNYAVQLVQGADYYGKRLPKAEAAIIVDMLKVEER